MGNRPEQMNLPEIRMPLNNFEKATGEDFHEEIRRNKEIYFAHGTMPEKYRGIIGNISPGVGILTSEKVDSGDLKFTITYVDGGHNIARSTMLVPDINNADGRVISRLWNVQKGWNLKRRSEIDPGTDHFALDRATQDLPYAIKQTELEQNPPEFDA